MNNGAPIDPTNPSSMPYTEPKKSNGGKIALIIIIVLLFLIGLPIILVVVILGGTFGIIKSVSEDLERGNKLVCTSGSSSLTVYYDNDSVNGIMSRGGAFDYDTEDIEYYTRGYSNMEDGLIDFSNSLVNSSTNTKCELNGTDITTLTPSENDKDNKTANGSAGSMSTGFIALPSGWAKVPSGSSTLRYQGETDGDLVEFDGYNLSSATTLQEAAQIYIGENTFVFDDELKTTNVMIGKNKGIEAIRIHYDSIVFPSTAFVFKSNTGFHIIEFKTEDLENLPALEEYIYTYHDSFDLQPVESTESDNLETVEQSI